MKHYFQVFAFAGLAALAACGSHDATTRAPSATLAEANPYVQAAAKSVAKAKPALPGLASIAWSALEHPERVSFSGTGKHATAVFATGPNLSLGDVVVENYLTMETDVFTATVEAQLDRLLKREIDRRNGTGNNPPPPVVTPGNGGSTLPDVAIDAAAADENPYTAGSDAAIARFKARLPKLQTIVFSELSEDALVSFSGTGQHATAHFSNGTTRDLGDVVIENYMTMEPLAFATVVYRQLSKALDKIPAG